MILVKVELHIECKLPFRLTSVFSDTIIITYLGNKGNYDDYYCDWWQTLPT